MEWSDYMDESVEIEQIFYDSSLQFMEFCQLKVQNQEKFYEKSIKKPKLLLAPQDKRKTLTSSDSHPSYAGTNAMAGLNDVCECHLRGFCGRRWQADSVQSKTVESVISLAINC